MKIKSLDELQIWQLARTFVDTVSAVLDRPTFGRDQKLRDQLDHSSVSILSNVSEGFGQRSDRAFARHLAIARGSNNEAISQLGVARTRRHITPLEYVEFEQMSRAMGKMMTRLIAYLDRADRKCRG